MLLDFDSEMPAGIHRYTQRVHEICLQRMIEGTASERVKRAINTKTLPCHQAMEYVVGMQVEFCETAGSKDTSPWLGPATIVNMDKDDRGVIGIKYKGEPKSVSPGALRPWMEPIAFHAE